MSGQQPQEKSRPHYDLMLVRRAFQDDEFHLPKRVQRHLERFGGSRETCRALVLRVTPTDFHKSQAHRTREGVWLDIYRPVIEGARRYIKITEDENELGFLVLSCCLDGHAH